MRNSQSILLFSLEACGEGYMQMYNYIVVLDNDVYIGDN